ncbi:hypothetical protein BC332_23931 [Capsicum chinense]|nr:hypothetical protein BC332_23931 [Capsicum chinense]
MHLPRLIPQSPCWEWTWQWRNFSHGRVNFVITRDGKPKFETHEVEAPKKEKWKAKTKLKLQRKREKKKKKRKAANKRDPRRLGVKGKKKQKFDTPEERIKHKIENAKDKEAMRIERLKRYEVSKVQGPEVQPHFLTGEEQFYIKKMDKKITCKPCKPGQIQEYGDEIARLSGGIPIQIVANDTIVFSRGREYVQPEIMHPIDTLSKKRALEKSKYEQSLESLRRFIAIDEKELELYYRHVAVYDDPNNRIAYSILDDSRSTSEKQNGKIGEENYSSSESIASDLELSQIDDGCVGISLKLVQNLHGQIVITDLISMAHASFTRNYNKGHSGWLKRRPRYFPVDEAALPLTRGRGFDPRYGENSVGSTATLMGLATRDPD